MRIDLPELEGGAGKKLVYRWSFESSIDSPSTLASGRLFIYTQKMISRNAAGVFSGSLTALFRASTKPLFSFKAAINQGHLCSSKARGKRNVSCSSSCPTTTETCSDWVRATNSLEDCVKGDSTAAVSLDVEVEDDILHVVVG